MTCRRLLLITDWRYQHCSRSPFLLLQSRDSFGHFPRNGARPFGSALLATSPHTSSEGNPSNKGRPKVADCLKKAGDPAHSPGAAGIQTYPLTWVPAGHSEHSHSGRRGRELAVSKLIHPEDTPPALPQPEGPSGAESSRGYENAASLVFLPCFSPADSQNRLAASEGRGVLEENKRILPPILSRGVAFPSQMWHTGQTISNEITRAPLLAEKSQPGEDTQSSCQTGLYRGCLPQTRGLSPGCMASTIFSPPVATAPGGKTQWRGKALEGGNVFPWNV